MFYKLETFFNNVKNPHYFGLAIIILVAFLFVGGNIYSVATCTEEVAATVEYVGVSPRYEEGLITEFSYSYQGEQYKGEYLSSPGQDEKGDSFTIKVNPNNPSRFIKDPKAYFGETVTKVACVLALAAVVAFVFKRFHKKK